MHLEQLGDRCAAETFGGQPRHPGGVQRHKPRPAVAYDGAGRRPARMIALPHAQPVTRQQTSGATVAGAPLVRTRRAPETSRPVLERGQAAVAIPGVTRRLVGQAGTTGRRGGGAAVVGAVAIGGNDAARAARDQRQAATAGPIRRLATRRGRDPPTPATSNSHHRSLTSRSRAWRASSGWATATPSSGQAPSLSLGAGRRSAGSGRRRGAITSAFPPGAASADSRSHGPRVQSASPMKLDYFPSERQPWRRPPPRAVEGWLEQPRWRG